MRSGGQRLQHNGRGEHHRRNREGDRGFLSRSPPPADGTVTIAGAAALSGPIAFPILFGLNERRQTCRGIGIPAVQCSLKCAFGLREISVGSEEDPEPARRGSVAGSVSKRVRLFRAGQVTPLFKQPAEVEGAVHISACVCTQVAGFRLLEIPTLFDKDPQIDRRARMAKRVGVAIREFGRVQISAFIEQKPEAESLDGRVSAVENCISAPSHPPTAFAP